MRICVDFDPFLVKKWTHNKSSTFCRGVKWRWLHGKPPGSSSAFLGVDFSFFSAIVLFKNQSPFPTRVFGGFLERLGCLGSEWGKKPSTYTYIYTYVYIYIYIAHLSIAANPYFRGTPVVPGPPLGLDLVRRGTRRRHHGRGVVPGAAQPRVCHGGGGGAGGAGLQGEFKSRHFVFPFWFPLNPT